MVANGANGTTGMVAMDRGVVAMNRGVVADSFATFASLATFATVPPVRFLESTAISVVIKTRVVTIETIIKATKANTAIVSSLASFATLAAIVTATATDPFTDFVAILLGVA